MGVTKQISTKNVQGLNSKTNHNSDELGVEIDVEYVFELQRDIFYQLSSRRVNEDLGLPLRMGNI